MLTLSSLYSGWHARPLASSPGGSTDTHTFFKHLLGGSGGCLDSRCARAAPLTQRISAADSVGVGGQCRLQDAAELMSDDLVDVAEGDVFDVEQLTADPVQGVVLMHQDGVGQPVEMSQGQDRVVVLDDHLTEDQEQKITAGTPRAGCLWSPYLPRHVRPGEMIDCEGLGVGVSETLRDVGAHAGARSSGHTHQSQKAGQSVAALRLSPQQILHLFSVTRTVDTKPGAGQKTPTHRPPSITAPCRISDV